MKNLLSMVARLQNNRPITSGYTIPGDLAKEELPQLEKLMERLGGSKKMISTCLSLFLEEVPAMLSKIDIANASRDMKTVKDACHELRGSLVTMEMRKAGKIAARIEVLAGYEKSDEIGNLLPTLKKEINNAVDKIRSIL